MACEGTIPCPEHENRTYRYGEVHYSRGDRWCVSDYLERKVRISSERWCCHIATRDWVLPLDLEAREAAVRSVVENPQLVWRPPGNFAVWYRGCDWHHQDALTVLVVSDDDPPWILTSWADPLPGDELPQPDELIYSDDSGRICGDGRLMSESLQDGLVRARRLELRADLARSMYEATYTEALDLAFDITGDTKAALITLKAAWIRILDADWESWDHLGEASRRAHVLEAVKECASGR